MPHSEAFPWGKVPSVARRMRGDTNRPLISRHRTMYELSPGIACLKISIFLKQVRYRAGQGSDDTVRSLHELSPGIACLKISIFLKQVRYRAGQGCDDTVRTMHELSPGIAPGCTQIIDARTIPSGSGQKRLAKHCARIVSGDSPHS